MDEKLNAVARFEMKTITDDVGGGGLSFYSECGFQGASSYILRWVSAVHGSGPAKLRYGRSRCRRLHESPKCPCLYPRSCARSADRHVQLATTPPNHRYNRGFAMKAKPKLDLSYYWDRFDEVLGERHGGETFKAGFTTIKEIYKDVRAGKRRLTVDDVMAIFGDDLPFVLDWTKPDRQRLKERMEEHRVSDAVYRLRDRKDDTGILDLVSQIRYGFGDLSLTALVLHHVYPGRFAMCSHHLASLLYIVNASTVPKFYLAYCEELQMWSHERSTRQLDVAETEFALWTWYRLTYYGKNEERKKNRDNFFKDQWVQDRRASRIAYALQGLGRLDIARSYLHTDANVAAIIAWVEFESSVRKLLGAEKARDLGVIDLINKLPVQAVPRTREELKRLCLRNTRGRNEVIHQGLKLTRKEAEELVNDVVEFLAHNS